MVIIGASQLTVHRTLLSPNEARGTEEHTKFDTSGTSGKPARKDGTLHEDSPCIYNGRRVAAACTLRGSHKTCSSTRDFWDDGGRERLEN